MSCLLYGKHDTQAVLPFSSRAVCFLLLVFISFLFVFFLSPSYLVTQIRGHIARPSPPSPLRFVPFILIARRPFLPSSTRVEYTVPGVMFDVLPRRPEGGNMWARIDLKQRGALQYRDLPVYVPRNFSRKRYSRIRRPASARRLCRRRNAIPSRVDASSSIYARKPVFSGASRRHFGLIMLVPT